MSAKKNEHTLSPQQTIDCYTTYMTVHPDIRPEAYIPKLQSRLEGGNTSKKSCYQHIVDMPFSEPLLMATLDLGIIVFLLVNKEDGMIDRVALSNTEQAKGATSVSAVPFHDIRIPLTDPENAIAAAIRTGEHQLVEDWQFLFTPALKPEEARRNQSSASVECSLVWPLTANGGGALIFSFYQPPEFITDEHTKFAENYAKVVEKVLEVA